MIDHPLQVELKTRSAEVDAAAAKLADLAGRRKSLTQQMLALGDTVRAASDAHRAAAVAGDAKAINTARKARRDADAELEDAQLALEGVQAAEQAAEHALKVARRQRALVAVDILRIEVAAREDRARQIFASFAATMRDRHALARLAADLMSEADGRVSEPIRYTDPNAGQLQRGDNDTGFAGVLIQHGLTDRFGVAGGLESASLDDLYAFVLPPVAEAAE